MTALTPEPQIVIVDVIERERDGDVRDPDVGWVARQWTEYAVVVNGYEEDCYPERDEAERLAAAFREGREKPTETRTPDEIQAAYLAGVDQAVEDARLACAAAAHDAEAWAKALDTFRDMKEIARKAQLDAYGEPCLRCMDEDEIPTGKVEVYHRRTDEYETQRCPACGGAKVVMPEVNQATRAGWPRERDPYHEQF